MIDFNHFIFQCFNKILIYHFLFFVDKFILVFLKYRYKFIKINYCFKFFKDFIILFIEFFILDVKVHQSLYLFILKKNPFLFLNLKTFSLNSDQLQ